MTRDVILTCAAYFTFSSAADAMLPPLAGNERSAYGFFYRFSQRLAANGTRLMESKLPTLTAGAALASPTMEAYMKFSPILAAALLLLVPFAAFHSGFVAALGLVLVAGVLMLARPAFRRFALCLAVICLLLPATGCNSFERTAFQSLSASKAVIDTAQKDYEPPPVGTGKLPHSACVNALINDAKASQQTGVDALQAYDVALKANADTTAVGAAVTADIATIVADVAKVKALYAGTSCS